MKRLTKAAVVTTCLGLAVVVFDAQGTFSLALPVGKQSCVTLYTLPFFGMLSERASEWWVSIYLLAMIALSALWIAVGTRELFYWVGKLTPGRTT